MNLISFALCNLSFIVFFPYISLVFNLIVLKYFMINALSTATELFREKTVLMSSIIQLVLRGPDFTAASHTYWLFLLKERNEGRIQREAM